LESLETFGNLGRDNDLEACYFNKTNFGGLWMKWSPAIPYPYYLRKWGESR
jgi:hypothetical protein